MNRLELKHKRRTRRKFAVRKKITGVAERPRLTVFKSNGQIYAQIIDDTIGKTLVSASTIDKEVKEILKQKKTKIEQSKLVGAEIAKRAIANNIKTVAFDRNGYLYHGRVKSLADGAREAGLVF
jgi:large subunit ribosomal protein L18